jgi:hypothetical protein
MPGRGRSKPSTFTNLLRFFIDIDSINLFPEIRVTPNNDNYIALQAIDRVFLFPKQLAWMEIKEE